MFRILVWISKARAIISLIMVGVGLVLKLGVT